MLISSCLRQDNKDNNNIFIISVICSNERGAMKLTTIKTYKPFANDTVLLFYLNAKEALFDFEYFPVSAPEDAGGSLLLFLGELAGKKNVCVKARRLDKENSNLICEAKIALKEALDSMAATKSKRLVVLLDNAPDDMVLAVQEGVQLGAYSFNKYKKDNKKDNRSVIIQTVNNTKIRSSLAVFDKLYKWVNFARDILNEPANSIYPASLAKIMQTKGRSAGLKMSVWNEQRLKKERCGGVLAVGSGAKSRPCMVIGEYNPVKYSKHVVLVGKGVTFDTGGYCLKPGSSQLGMKMDMGGAAMMFSAACAIAEAKLPVKLTVITPLVENDISVDAFHTEDILKMRNGLTVEVGNTDAEGRLVLADALTLACEKNADYVIDSATLTGACLVGLGEDIAGLYSTDSILSGLLLDAAEDAGEYMWELPLHMPYTKLLESTIADTSNMGGKYGGSLTAALFLKKFVNDDMPWAHIDIAGPAIKTDPHEHLGKGAKGYGVKAIYYFAKSLT